MNHLNNIAGITRILYDKGYDFLFEMDLNPVIREQKSPYNILDKTWFWFSEPNLICDNIYIGSAYNVANYQNLIDKDIKLIVNCTVEITNYFEGYFDYFKINLRDEKGSEIKKEQFDELLDLYKKNKDKNIMVHCFMGASRSAICVLLYLVKMKGMELDDAITFIREKRNIININNNFLKDLKNYLEIN